MIFLKTRCGSFRAFRERLQPCLTACLFLLLAFIGFPVSAYADNIVVLKPSTEVNSASIRLSDVFSGIPETVDRPIASSPAAGKSVTYDARILFALAEKYRLNWKPESLADRAVLTRAATKITQDMIKAAVLDKLQNENIRGKTEIVFDSRSLEINLPADRAPKFVLNNFNYEPANKRFRSEFFAETGGSPIALPVTGRVLVKRDVPVLNRRLEAGTTIGKADLDWISLQDDRITADMVTDPSELIGREVRHDTQRDQPLHSRDVIPPRLVTRGSLVIMKIQTPYMLITAQGRVLQDGTAGDVVRVTNTQSNRVVEGVVDGAGVVTIQTAQKLTLAQQ